MPEKEQSQEPSELIFQFGEVVLRNDDQPMVIVGLPSPVENATPELFVAPIVDGTKGHEQVNMAGTITTDQLRTTQEEPWSPERIAQAVLRALPGAPEEAITNLIRQFEKEADKPTVRYTPPTYLI